MNRAEFQQKYPDFSPAAMTNVTRFDGPEWRQKLYRQRDAYYGQYTPALKMKPGAPNDNVAINLCQVIVDKAVSFLFGRGVSFNLDGTETRTDMEKYLDETLAANQGAVFFQRVATNGAIYGMGFVKIRIQAGSRYPKLMVLDPEMVSVETRYDDYDEVNTYTIKWDVPKPEDSKRRIYFRQQIIRIPAMTVQNDDGSFDNPPMWKIVDSYADKSEMRDKYPLVDAQSWVTFGSELWPFPFPPILEVPNLPAPNSYWGMACIEPDVIALVEAANYSLSNINRILRLHAHPKTVTVGLSPSQQQQVVVNVDGILNLPGDKSEVDIKNLEMTSDLASSINFYGKLRDGLYERSRIPEVSSGKVQNLSYLSALAMQMLYGPGFELRAVMRSTYGNFIIELCRRLLAIAGRGDTNIVDVLWPETFPRDLMVEAQTAIYKQQVGFSQDTLVSELGGNAEREKELRQGDIEEKAKLAEAESPPSPPTPPAPSNGPTRQGKPE